MYRAVLAVRGDVTFRPRLGPSETRAIFAKRTGTGWGVDLPT